MALRGWKGGTRKGETRGNILDEEFYFRVEFVYI